MDSITRLNNAVNQACVDLQKDIKDIQQEFADESFNPFLEVCVEEEKQADPDNPNLDKKLSLKHVSLINERINDAITIISQDLQVVHNNVCEDLNRWLASKSAPEQLNMESKQHVLKQKLKWEKMFSSKEKLSQLKKIIRKFKKRR